MEEVINSLAQMEVLLLTCLRFSRRMLGLVNLGRNPENRLLAQLALGLGY